MNTEQQKTVRSKVAVNVAVYVWAFAALVAAPALQISPFAKTVIFYVYVGAGLMVVAWPTYATFRYGTAHEQN